jgi:hypothetical protein
LNERWELPSDIERSVPSQARSTNWQEVENIEDLEKFFLEESGLLDLELGSLESKNSAVTAEKVRLENELANLVANLANIKKEKILQKGAASTLEGDAELNE